MACEDLLRIDHLRVVFRGLGWKTTAVNDVSFSIRPREVFGLAGESGSGKTTIARTVMRLQHAESGSILLRGEPILGKAGIHRYPSLSREIQMIFQDPCTSMNDRATIFDIVGEGLKYTYKMGPEERRETVAEALKEAGLLPEDMNRFPHAFSGGQLQRIGIARALVMRPNLIIADEPVSALDLSVRGNILQLMRRLQLQHGLSYLFISHDLSLMRSFCDRIAILLQGQIVEMGSVAEIFRAPTHPYTRVLLSAIPVPNPDIERSRAFPEWNGSVKQYGEWTQVGDNHFALV